MDLLALRIRENAPMLSNRDDFRHFASSDRLRVTIRSVLSETRHNLRILVVEMRSHDIAKWTTPVRRRARFRDCARCSASPLEYRCRKLLYRQNKASQLPTFDFWVIFSYIRRFRATRGVSAPQTSKFTIRFEIFDQNDLGA